MGEDRGLKCVVIGGGPVGALAGLYAARRGWDVEVYDLRPGTNEIHAQFFANEQQADPTQICEMNTLRLSTLHVLSIWHYQNEESMHCEEQSRPHCWKPSWRRQSLCMDG